MARAMLASVVITALLGMNSIGHAQSGTVDTRDYLIWQRGGKPKSTKGLMGTPGQKTRANKIKSKTLCVPLGSSKPGARC